MSVTYHIGCATCKEHLWIGQRDYIYTSEPETTQLSEFLFKHQQHVSLHPEMPPEHVLIFARSEVFWDAWPEWTELHSEYKDD